MKLLSKTSPLNSRLLFYRSNATGEDFAVSRSSKIKPVIDDVFGSFRLGCLCIVLNGTNQLFVALLVGKFLNASKCIEVVLCMQIG